MDDHKKRPILCLVLDFQSGQEVVLLLHLHKIDATWQNVSIFATATAQNSHKNFHQFYLPKNLCHGGTQKEVEQVSELHTWSQPWFLTTHQWYDQ